MSFWSINPNDKSYFKTMLNKLNKCILKVILIKFISSHVKKSSTLRCGYIQQLHAMRLGIRVKCIKTYSTSVPTSLLSHSPVNFHILTKIRHCHLCTRQGQYYSHSQHIQYYSTEISLPTSILWSPQFKHILLNISRNFTCKCFLDIIRRLSLSSMA